MNPSCLGLFKGIKPKEAWRTPDGRQDMPQTVYPGRPGGGYGGGSMGGYPGGVWYGVGMVWVVVPGYGYGYG